MGKRSRSLVKAVGEDFIEMEMTDQDGQTVKRKITLSADRFQVTDESAGKKLQAYVHFSSESNFGDISDVWFALDDEYIQNKQDYAVEYGIKKEVSVVELSGVGKIEFDFAYEMLTV